MSWHASLLSAAVWREGHWVDPSKDEQPPMVAAAVPLLAPLNVDRIARADRYTQLAALVSARVIAASTPIASSDSLSVLTASVLATAHTNERFEQRRIEGRAPEPRSFPYTAPNAAAGELAIALRARGPTAALVGDSNVALHAVARACSWIKSNRCERALVVAVECPPEHTAVVGARSQPPIECAASWLLGSPGDPTSIATVAIAYCIDVDVVEATPMLSVHPLMQLWTSMHREGRGEWRGTDGAGIGLHCVTEINR